MHGLRTGATQTERERERDSDEEGESQRGGEERGREQEGGVFTQGRVTPPVSGDFQERSCWSLSHSCRLRLSVSIGRLSLFRNFSLLTDFAGTSKRPKRGNGKCFQITSDGLIWKRPP